MRDIRSAIRSALFLDAVLPQALKIPGATLYAREGVEFGPDAPFVCAIGAFDGLHQGHRALIDAARTDAAERGLPLALATFAPDPAEVLSRRNPERLCTDGDRILALGSTVPDLIIVFDFTWEFSRNSYEAFTLDILGSLISPVAIHVGVDFNFGADGAGSASDIAKLGASHGFTAIGHELVRYEGTPVSSTLIRSFIKGGRLDEAEYLLGRPFMMRALARTDGDSAQVAFDERSCMPASGAFACAIVCDGVARMASVCLDAASCSAAVIPSCAIPSGSERCSVVFFSAISESDDSFARMWVQQTEIMLNNEGVDA